MGVNAPKLLRITGLFLIPVTLLIVFTGLLMKSYSFIKLVEYKHLYTIHVLSVLPFLLLFYLHSLFAFFILVKKKILRKLCVILWSFLFLLLIALYIFPYVSVQFLPPKIRLSEVEKHNTPEDCWIIIGNKVYDVTDYIPIHPGGPDTIIPLCGKNATLEFYMVHRGNECDLEKFYIGDVYE